MTRRTPFVLCLLAACSAAPPPAESPPPAPIATRVASAPPGAAPAAPPASAPPSTSQPAASDGAAPSFGPATVLVYAVENGDGAGSDYEFIDIIRTRDDKGMGYDWSASAPLSAAGSRAVEPSALASSRIIDNWHTNGESGMKRGASSIVLSRDSVDRLRAGERVEIDIVPVGKRLLRSTRTVATSIRVGESTRSFATLRLDADNGDWLLVLDASDFAVVVEQSLTFPVAAGPDPAALMAALPASALPPELRAALAAAAAAQPAAAKKWHSRLVGIRSPGGGTVQAELAAGRLVSHALHFDSGADTIRVESQGALDEIAAFLKANPSTRLRIEGHTDGSGEAADNQRLSERRAASLRAQLVTRGIAATRLETVGRGETQPIADNGTLEGRAENRRVVFEVLR